MKRKNDPKSVSDIKAMLKELGQQCNRVAAFPDEITDLDFWIQAVHYIAQDAERLNEVTRVSVNHIKAININKSKIRRVK